MLHCLTRRLEKGCENLTVMRMKTSFKNKNILHRLKKLGMDGCQKLPLCVLEPPFENLSDGRPYSRLLTMVASWMKYLQLQYCCSTPNKINDPLKKQPISAIRNAENNADLVSNMIKFAPVFGDYPWQKIEEDIKNALGLSGLITSLFSQEGSNS